MRNRGHRRSVPAAEWRHPLFIAVRQISCLQEFHMVMMQQLCGATLHCRRISDSTRALRKDEYADVNESSDTEVLVSDNNNHNLNHQRRTHLKYSRSHRRKMKSRKRNEYSSVVTETDADSSQDGSSVNDDTNKTSPPPSPEGYTLPNGEFVFGSPHFGNPIRERYIRSLQKIHYPKTFHGWKTVFRKAWEKYLWTYEGFLLKPKKRDEHGNVIIEEDGETNENEGAENNNKSLRDTASDAATGVAKNVQKNITTLQQEAPHFLQMGQQITGVSSKEELREWVRDQLKLGTACLTEFMAGYRNGRDEEIDKMLHAYFNELDDDKTKEEGSTSRDDNRVDDINNSQDEPKSEVQEQRISGIRAWGRSERRRLKRLSNRASKEADQPTNDQ